VLRALPDGSGAEVTAAPPGTVKIRQAWSDALTGGNTLYSKPAEDLVYKPGVVIPASKAGYPYLGALGKSSTGQTVGKWADPRCLVSAPAPGPTPTPTPEPKPAPSGLIVAAGIYQLSPTTKKGTSGVAAGPDVSACVKAVRMCGTSRGSTNAALSNANLEAWMKIGCGVIMLDFNGGMTMASIPINVWTDRFVQRQLVNPLALEEGNETYEPPWGPNQTSQAAIDAYFQRLEATRVAMDKAYGRGHYAPLLACCQGSEKMFYTNALAAKGLKDVVDGAVVHCYPKESQSETTGKDCSFERAAEVNQATGLRIWITEFCPPAPGKFTNANAATAIKAFIGKCRATPYVAAAAYFAYEERKEGSYGFGLVDENWQHKPQYAALQSVA
jgi:hypothetical protein